MTSPTPTALARAGLGALLGLALSLAAPGARADATLNKPIRSHRTQLAGRQS